MCLNECPAGGSGRDTCPATAQSSDDQRDYTLGLVHNEEPHFDPEHEATLNNPVRLSFSNARNLLNRRSLANFSDILYAGCLRFNTSERPNESLFFETAMRDSRANPSRRIRESPN
jgi:hypothetical protein